MVDDHKNISIGSKAVQSLVVMSCSQLWLESFTLCVCGTVPPAVPCHQTLASCVCVEGLQSLHQQLSSVVSGPQLSFVICGPASVPLKSLITEYIAKNLCIKRSESIHFLFPGSNKVIDVIDVARQADSKLKLGEFVKYYYQPERPKVLNVISLEFSDTKYVCVRNCAT